LRETPTSGQDQVLAENTPEDQARDEADIEENRL
jgi:hypothetical protein